MTEPSTPQKPADGGQSDARATAEFVEHAKWLIDWHGKRSDSLATRATALLGFAGVTLALLLQGTTVPGVDPTRCFRAVLILTGLALVGSALFCLLAIKTTQTIAPSAAQVRRWWQKYTKVPVRSNYPENIAETLLNGADLNGTSPLDAAIAEADRRAHRFKWATGLLFVALIGVLVLAIQIFQQVR